MKTREEVEKLKKGWCCDGCWDLPNTEGFEEYKAELEQFVVEYTMAKEAKEAARVKDLQNKWHTIKLNESFMLDSYTTITRVPGGWIHTEIQCVKEPSYHRDDGVDAMTTVFIPYSNEFKGQS